MPTYGFSYSGPRLTLAQRQAAQRAQFLASLRAKARR